jgi:hypothetical protein
MHDIPDSSAVESVSVSVSEGGSVELGLRSTELYASTLVMSSSLLSLIKRKYSPLCIALPNCADITAGDELPVAVTV